MKERFPPWVYDEDDLYPDDEEKGYQVRSHRPQSDNAEENALLMIIGPEHAFQVLGGRDNWCTPMRQTG